MLGSTCAYTLYSEEVGVLRSTAMAHSMAHSLSSRASAFTASTLPPRSAFSGRVVVAPSRTSVVVQASQEIKGTVVSTATAKTAVVEVVRLAPHPKYFKRTRQTKRYICHDETGICKVGDVVRIEGCRPLSKNKRFEVAEVVLKRQ